MSRKRRVSFNYKMIPGSKKATLFSYDIHYSEYEYRLYGIIAFVASIVMILNGYVLATIIPLVNLVVIPGCLFLFEDEIISFILKKDVLYQNYKRTGEDKYKDIMGRQDYVYGYRGGKIVAVLSIGTIVLMLIIYLLFYD